MAGSETRIKTTTTTLRLTPEERADVMAAATAQGVGPSTFARIATLKAAGRTPATIRRRNPDAVDRARLLGELGHWGRNLNQMTRYAHKGGRVDPVELRALREVVERLTLAVMR